MTVSTSTATKTYNGDGSTVSFPTEFAFFNAADIEVIERVVVTGVETVKALTTDYTVTGGEGITGTVVAVVAPSANVTWTIRRAVAENQETDLPVAGSLPSTAIEKMIDRAVMMVQQHSDEFGRTLTFPKTDSDTLDPTVPNSVDRANKHLTFDASGNPTVSSSSSTQTLVAALLDLKDQTHSGDGSTTAFNLTFAPGSAQGLIITVDNVLQTPITTYTVSDNTLTFTSPPPSGASNIYIRYLGLEAETAGFGDGSDASPSVFFSSNASTGLFLNTAGNIGFASNGTKVANFNGGQAEFLDGGEFSPGISFLNDPDSGIFRIAANTLGITLGGNKVAQFNTNPSAINFVDFTAQGTSGAAVVRAQGEPNSRLSLSSNGVGNVELRTNNTSDLQVMITHSASAVNNWVITGSATGSPLSIGAFGVDVNIGLQISPKALGNVGIAGVPDAQAIVTAYKSNSDAIIIARALTNGHAAEHRSTANNAAGALANSFSSYIGNTLDWRINGGGNGAPANSINFQTGATGALQVRVSPIANAVNYWDLSGNIATGGIRLKSLGTDTNVDMSLMSKGSGTIWFNSHGADGTRNFAVKATSGALNYLQATGSPSGTPSLVAVGTSSNIGIQFQAKGTSGLLLDADTTSVRTRSGSSMAIWGAQANGTNILKMFDGTAPNINPNGGGFLYSEAGALKWRGSSGTITAIAPA